MPVTPVKTIGTSLIAWTDLASATQSISSVIDVSTTWAVAFNIALARLTGSAFTVGWPNVRIEASGAASGNDAWIPLLTLQMAVGATIVNTTFNGAISAAATTCVVTSATNVAISDLLFLGDASTANYEIVRVKLVSGTTVTFEEACTYGHSNGALITDQSEVYFPVLDVSAYSRIRVIIDNANSGQGIKARVTYNKFDSF